MPYGGRREIEAMSGRRDCAGAVLVRQGRILLGRRNAAKSAAPGCWDVIGGTLEDGETFEQACVREIFEELGVHARIEDELVRTRLEDGSEYRIFRVLDWDGEPRLANDEHTMLVWVLPGEAGHLVPLASAEYLALFALLGADNG